MRPLGLCPGALRRAARHGDAAQPMRPLLLGSLLALSACATAGQAPAPAAARPRPAPFRAAPPMTELARERAEDRHAAAQAILARPEARPEEVEQAALHLEAACREGYPDACSFLTAHATPVRGQCPRLQITRDFLVAKANAETHVRCRISAAGVSEACAVVLEAPYGLSEQHLESRRRCAYEPARLMGRPYPTDDLSTAEYLMPFMELEGGRIQTSGDALHEARRRVDQFPQSAGAQRHLALVLEQRQPGSAEYLRALQRARERLPLDAELLAAAARVSMTQGRGAEAFELALAAVQAQPRSLLVLQTYGAAALQVGHCKDAVRAQQYVLADYGARSSESAREQMAKRLETYEKQCAAVAQPAAP